MVVRRKLKNNEDQLKESKPDDPQTKKVTKSKRSPLKVLLLGVFLALLTLYSVSPFVVRYSHFVQKEFIYVNRINIPLFANFSDPTGFGLPKAKNFYLQHSDGCKIGVWQVLPEKYHQKTTPEEDYPSHLSDGLPVVLYLHGNTGSRATYHRIQLYRLLTENKGHHVVTFDYRGFGDSDCSPSETGLMEDGLLVWQWIKGHAPNARVYLWGHSLGSGAATYLASNLTSTGYSPTGILLDAPFTTIIEAAYHHPFSLPYWPIRDLFKAISLDFIHETHSSVERILSITCPILIMHGHKDIIVPFALGQRLYQVALATRKPGNGAVQFVDCGDTGHKYNYRSKQLLEALDTFIQ